MQRQSAALFACLALAIVAGLVWFLMMERPGLQSAASGGVTTADAEGTGAAVAIVDHPATDAAMRTTAEEVAVRPERTAGEAVASLLVHVVWSDDQPAPGVGVHVVRSRRGQPYGVLARAVSDATGTARLGRLSPGQLVLRTDRGCEVKVELAAGREQEVTCKVPAGVAVEGIVRDSAGAPVAGAGIWLTSYENAAAGGRVVAQSATDGTFRLRDVPKEQSLGALVPGYAPSPLVDLEDLDVQVQPVHVELRVTQTGGRLAGRVVDAARRPVPGVTLAIGRADLRADYRNGGGRVEQWQPRIAISDDQGAFAVDSLAPGKQPVETQSERHPAWRGTCEIKAGETFELITELPDGVTVHGSVRGSDGAPLAGAVVRAFAEPLPEQYLQFGQFDHDRVFACPFAVSDATGGYRLANATPGELHLYAIAARAPQLQEPMQWDAAVLQGPPGGDLEWNALIGSGLTLEGVVLYRNGTPMHGAFVTANEVGTMQRHVITTDREGRFRHVRMQDRPYDVSVQLWDPPPGTRPLVQRGVSPGHANLRLVAGYDPKAKAAPGKVRGRIQDQAGRLRGRFAASLPGNRGQYTGHVDGETFVFEQVEPGEYCVVLLANDDPIHVTPKFTVAAGQEVDLGALVTEPGGTLVLQLPREPSNAALQPKVWFSRRGGGSKTVQPGTAAELRVENLCTGEYEIGAYGEGLAVGGRVNCSVTAGGETEVSLRLRAGAERELAVDFPADQEIAAIRLLEGGSAVWTFEPGSYALPRPWSMKLTLSLGNFVLRAETAAGLAQDMPFSMSSLAKDQHPVRLDLR